MPFTVNATARTDFPGAVEIIATGDANTNCTLQRIDGGLNHPVRNFDGIGASGAEQLVDMEAPLGREVYYNLVDPYGTILTQSNAVAAPALASGRGILRSVLAPEVLWMEVEPQDETGVEWATSTRAYEVVGSDTPVVVAEIRQRHTGTISFLCRSIAEANRLVLILRDGHPMLLRHPPCAQDQARDMLFYALTIDERRYGYTPWRILHVEYQTTSFVPGRTVAIPPSWTFAAMRDAAPDFATLSSLWGPSGTFFAAMTQPRPAWTPRAGDAPLPYTPAFPDS